MDRTYSSFNVDQQRPTNRALETDDLSNAQSEGSLDVSTVIIEPERPVAAPVEYWPQFITWGMLITGWILTLIIYKKNKNNGLAQRKVDRHNCYVTELRSLLLEIESETCEFWTTCESDSDLLSMRRLQRKLKELTGKAKEIEDSGGPQYPHKLFINLRQCVTLDGDSRPLTCNSYRLEHLRELVNRLSLIYQRRLD